jgi:hypothetical protein
LRAKRGNPVFLSESWIASLLTGRRQRRPCAPRNDAEKVDRA